MTSEYKKTANFESRIENIMLERFGQKMDDSLKGMLSNGASSDKSKKAFETACLLMTMLLISDYKKANSKIQTKTVQERVKLTLDRLNDMKTQREISSTMHLSCNQELNKLVL